MQRVGATGPAVCWWSFPMGLDRVGGRQGGPAPFAAESVRLVAVASSSPLAVSGPMPCAATSCGGMARVMRRRRASSRNELLVELGGAPGALTRMTTRPGQAGEP